MKIYYLWIAAALFSTHIAAQNQDTSIENAFDFWVGDWEVSWTGTNGDTIVGSNKIVKTLDGKVLQEHFEDPSQAYKGTSISVYDVSTKQWHQAWADNGGSFINLVGRLDGDNRIFEMPNKNSKGQRFRMVYKAIKDDSLIWEWQRVSEDKSWDVVWKINYKRKK